MWHALHWGNWKMFKNVQGLVSIGLQLLAMMLTNLLPDILIMAITVRALFPISGSNDSRKRHEMRLISKLGNVHPSGINECFSYV
jgi:hypothetical protein